MSFFLRKISRSKWERDSDGNSIPNADPNADAITSCTRTTDGTLSLWLINDEEEEEFNNGLLALATTMQKADAFDVLIVEQKVLANIFKIEKTPGQTPYKEMVDRHYDIVGLRYSTLKTVANVIIEGINSGKAKKIRRVTIKEIIEKAIAGNKLDKSSINEKLREDLWGKSS